MKNNPVDNSYVENLQEGLKQLMKRGEIEGKKDALNIDAPDNRRPDKGQNPLVAKTPKAKYKLKSAQDRANQDRRTPVIPPGETTNPTLRGGSEFRDSNEKSFRKDRTQHKAARGRKKPLAKSQPQNPQWKVRLRKKLNMRETLQPSLKEGSGGVKKLKRRIKKLEKNRDSGTSFARDHEKVIKSAERLGRKEGEGAIRRMNNETLQPSPKGTERQIAAKKASKALDSAVRSKKTSDNWYSELSTARKAALAKGGHMKTWKANREKSQGNTNPTNPRNKISSALMSVPGKHQKIKSGARWKKGKTRFEAVSYIDNRGHEPTVSKDEVKKMRPLNIKKKKQKNNNS